MKSFANHLSALIFFFALLISSCKSESIPTDPALNRCKFFYDNVPIVGGGVNNYNSWRNNHYKITIANDKTTISIKAAFKGVNGRIYILNSAGNSINYTNTEISPSIDDFVIDKAGTYYVVLNAEGIGTYSLDICGSVAAAELINSSKISFDNQNMPVGGGVSIYNSWRNNHFSFEVTEDDSDVDFLVKSKVTNCRIYILNSAGNSVSYTNTGTFPEISPLNLKKGLYYIVVNGEEDKATSFDLTIYSKTGVVANTKSITSTAFSKKTGAFSPGGGVDNYNSLLSRKFTLTVAATTYIDLIANSSGLNNRIYLLNSAGNSMTNTNSGVVTEIIAYKIDKGTYTVVVNGDKDKNGIFDLTLHSQEGTVSDLVPK